MACDDDAAAPRTNTESAGAAVSSTGEAGAALPDSRPRDGSSRVQQVQGRKCEQLPCILVMIHPFA
jgi:hypothetical protein